MANRRNLPRPVKRSFRNRRPQPLYRLPNDRDDAIGIGNDNHDTGNVTPMTSGNSNVDDANSNSSSSDEQSLDTLPLSMLRNLCSDLKKMQSENTLCDVTLKVNGSEVFHAHKNILAAGSGFFKSMFTSGFSNSSDTIDIFIEGGSDVFGILLDFIYTGVMNGMTTDNIDAVVSMACYLQLAQVALQQCQSFIQQILLMKPVMTCLPLETAAVISQRPEVELAELTKMMRKYMALQLCKFAQQPDFLEETTPDCLGIYLESVQEFIQDVKTLKKVFTIVDQWLRHKWDSRKFYTRTLLEKMSLDSLTVTSIISFRDSIRDKDLPDCHVIPKEAVKRAINRVQGDP